MEIDKYEKYAHYVCKRLIVKTPHGVVRLYQTRDTDSEALDFKGDTEAVNWLKNKVNSI